MVATGMILTAMNPEHVKVCVAETTVGRSPDVSSRSKTNSVAPNKLGAAALNKPEPEI